VQIALAHAWGLPLAAVSGMPVAWEIVAALVCARLCHRRAHAIPDPSEKP
jgi:hypothetical protein